ncbi:hypothetical protein QL093DRAFT_2477499 [Fusarium oxysporum]|nr:hypothetical protein QL093DRAFT_2477499 [Fusarium oxysporum]
MGLCCRQLARICLVSAILCDARSRPQHWRQCPRDGNMHEMLVGIKIGWHSSHKSVQPLFLRSSRTEVIASVVSLIQIRQL